jgi:hypothetical protein
MPPRSACFMRSIRPREGVGESAAGQAVSAQFPVPLEVAGRCGHVVGLSNESTSPVTFIRVKLQEFV